MSYRFRRFLTGLAAALFATYLIALPAHLVHHLSDEDHGRPACPHLAQSQHTPEIQTDPPTLTPPIATERLDAPLAGASLRSLRLTASHSRAPPGVAPSA